MGIALHMFNSVLRTSSLYCGGLIYTSGPELVLRTINLYCGYSILHYGRSTCTADGSFTPRLPNLYYVRSICTADIVCRIDTPLPHDIALSLRLSTGVSGSRFGVQFFLTLGWYLDAIPVPKTGTGFRSQNGNGHGSRLMILMTRTKNVERVSVPKMGTQTGTPGVTFGVFFFPPPIGRS